MFASHCRSPIDIIGRFKLWTPPYGSRAPVEFVRAREKVTEHGSIRERAIDCRDCAGAQETAFATSQQRLRDPALPGAMVASQRACWKSASENPLDSIRACIAHGIDIIEIDIRATADGRLVLMHDSTLDRMTNGHVVPARRDWRSCNVSRHSAEPQWGRNHGSGHQ
ncbi:hypothetical protein KRZ98_17725 [Sphingobium sp. AS12]|uniref:glycerophosphodiester phosphodiesterase family protein n=1 Tax=Sphingobium sp. AS12 TaxID=2849495 RepID=UPI001C31379A|nr:glycerophosphodiester phosphodiesterase family protein [Sphingobium sp. AS12]MBV2150085.1 hypothetical protein [Sphingobium sp. AS12]